MSRGKLVRVAVWLVVVAGVGFLGGFLMPGTRIADARQIVRVRLDGTDGHGDWSGRLNGRLDPKGRRLLCNAPFLILLLRRGAELPYLAFWVENTELLVP